jgi:hypothetical protein
MTGSLACIAGTIHGSNDRHGAVTVSDLLFHDPQVRATDWRVRLFHTT